MAIEVFETDLKNVLLIRPSVFEDSRGEFLEFYNRELYTAEISKKIGVKVNFVQDDAAVSFKNVLRGIHGDAKTWKIFSCLYGKVYAVIVDCDKSSENFGKWEPFTLSDKNRHQILVPPKYGTSYLVLSDSAIVHYKQSTYYNPKVLKQFTYRWDDPAFKIRWPIKNPILSKRDES